jgi:hypothetical protein
MTQKVYSISVPTVAIMNQTIEVTETSEISTHMTEESIQQHESTSVTNIGDDQSYRRLNLTRQRNEKNLVRLRKSFNVYKTIYGKDATREALMGIATQEFRSNRANELVGFVSSLNSVEPYYHSLSEKEATRRKSYISYRNSLGSLRTYRAAASFDSNDNRGIPLVTNRQSDTDLFQNKSNFASPLAALLGGVSFNSSESNRDVNIDNETSNANDTYADSSQLNSRNTEGTLNSVTAPSSPCNTELMLPISCQSITTPTINSPEAASQLTTSTTMAVVSTKVEKSSINKSLFASSSQEGEDTKNIESIKLCQSHSDIQCINTCDTNDQLLTLPKTQSLSLAPVPMMTSPDAASQVTSSTMMAIAPQKRVEAATTNPLFMTSSKVIVSRDDGSASCITSSTTQAVIPHKGETLKSMMLSNEGTPTNAICGSSRLANAGTSKVDESARMGMPINTSSTSNAVIPNNEGTPSEMMNNREDTMPPDPFVVPTSLSTNAPQKREERPISAMSKQIAPIGAPLYSKDSSLIPMCSPKSSSSQDDEMTTSSFEELEVPHVLSSSSSSFLATSTAKKLTANDGIQVTSSSEASFYADTTASFYAETATQSLVSIRSISSSSSAYGFRMKEKNKRNQQIQVADTVASSTVDRTVGIVSKMNKSRSRKKTKINDLSKHDGILTSSTPSPFSPKFLKGYLHYLHFK